MADIIVPHVLPQVCSSRESEQSASQTGSDPRSAEIQSYGLYYGKVLPYYVLKEIGGSKEIYRCLKGSGTNSSWCSTVYSSYKTIIVHLHMYKYVLQYTFMCIIMY